MTEPNIPPSDDPYRWLEDVTGTTALEWVAARNAESVQELAVGDRFDQLREEILEVLDSDDRIPFVVRRGDLLYNFWQDPANPKGVWRRTTLAEYRGPQPEWEVLLDVDALAEREGENWVWQGATLLRPDYRLALVELSRGGADAAVVREFDLETRAFVPDGFILPEAKSHVGWIDQDRIYVGTDFGPGSLTTSGYPMVVKEWRRGTPLADAVTVFEGKPDDVSVGASHDPTEGFERDIVVRGLDFWREERYLRRPGDELVRLDVPEDAGVDVHREWLLVHTRSPWRVDDTTYPAGALLAARFDEYLAGSRDLTVLFEPDAHNHLSYHAWTRHHVILHTLSDVRSRLTVLTPGEDGWTRTELPGVPADAYTDLAGTDPDVDDAYLLVSTGYTEPDTLRRGVVGTNEDEVLKRAPSFFDADGLSVRQFTTTSDDGTVIPYFVVGPDQPTGPTLLYGYGGFEIALTPSYDGVIGRAWLARGGTYVVANIRGGGEYGPEWHTQSLKASRHLVYEDFAAVARDLVARGLTTPERLGIRGGSNGGLLMGVMLTTYPELFGAIVCEVPLLDMYRYHELLAGASWIAEYGDPRADDEWEYIRKYSPYHNIRKGQPYPPTLFGTSTRDDRVHPGHARKMVARLLEYGYHVDYYENIEGGHGAAADNKQRAFKNALAYEFLWRTLGG
ncbi:MAG TPA: prolyl oligopeptidase family serine peptidase [Pseudonocardiaceae bacterium]|nr:prolyl oligopeptidase family serine peptidase [Pseudonocardiaceae bacterium]